MKRRRAVYAAGLALLLAPAAGLVLAGATGRLGANPIEEITHVTGEWALRFLLASLAVTPLRRLTGVASLAPWRRTVGLAAFFYAAAHLTTWLALEHAFDLTAIFEDIFERPFVTAGMVAFLCLLSLAISSTRGWQRRLRARWRKLHRLVYLAAIAAVLHHLWLVKADLRPPLIEAAVLTVLLAARLAPWARRHFRAGASVPGTPG